MIMLKNIIFLNKPKDLTNLLEFVKTLVIIEINGANFAHIFFKSIRDRNKIQFFFLDQGRRKGGCLAQPKQVFIYINILLPIYHYYFQDFRSNRILDHDKKA